MMISLRQIGYHNALFNRSGSMNAAPQHRLAKYIAMCGHCSRRAAERLISQGRVSVNGALAKHTETVSSVDVVMVDHVTLAPTMTLQYLAYHKPVGVDCNNKADDPASLYHVIKQLPQRVFAVGRLDKDSSGLLLLTNDGALCQRLLHPTSAHDKTYLVSTDKPISATFLQQLASGVSWQVGPHCYQSLPCRVWQSGPQQFHIVLTQGLNRQIRYMCRAQGFKVVSLKRIAIGQFALGDLAPGQYRPITTPELATLLQSADTPQP